jgi:antitoxin CptB
MPPMHETNADLRRRRLLFRARHRGTHETDLLVGGFVDAEIAAMDDEALDALEAVLELPDVDLFDWLTGRRPVPAEAASPLLARMVAWSLAQRGMTAPARSGGGGNG